MGLFGHFFRMDAGHHKNNAKSETEHVLLKSIVTRYKYIGLHFFPKVLAHE